MKKINLKLCLLLLFTTVAVTACHNTPNARHFKNGIFRSTLTDGGIIKRTGKIQTETIKGLPQAVYNVKWLDSLTYVLSATKETAEITKEPLDATVTVQITKTTDSSYFCKVTSNYSDRVMRAEYVKVK